MWSPSGSQATSGSMGRAPSGAKSRTNCQSSCASTPSCRGLLPGGLVCRNHLLLIGRCVSFGGCVCVCVCVLTQRLLGGGDVVVLCMFGWLRCCWHCMHAHMCILKTYQTMI
jgi:hypothetical protein